MADVEFGFHPVVLVAAVGMQKFDPRVAGVVDVACAELRLDPFRCDA